MTMLRVIAEASHGLRLPAYPRQRRRVEAFSLDQCQGNGAIEPCIVRQIHPFTAAHAQQPLDLVARPLAIAHISAGSATFRMFNTDRQEHLSRRSAGTGSLNLQQRCSLAAERSDVLAPNRQHRRACYVQRRLRGSPSSLANTHRPIAAELTVPQRERAGDRGRDRRRPAWEATEGSRRKRRYDDYLQ